MKQAKSLINTISKKELKELTEFLPLQESFKIPIGMKIIFDGKQHSVRIPRQFIEALDLNLEKDLFVFFLEIPPAWKNKKTKLKGELQRNIVKGKEADIKWEI